VTLLALLRHAETAWNAERRIQGQTDVPLSDIGRARLRGSSIAGFGYFHLLCTHSQSAGLARISASRRRA